MAVKRFCKKSYMNIYTVYMYTRFRAYHRIVSTTGGQKKSFHGAGCIKIRAVADIELSRYVRHSPAKLSISYGHFIKLKYDTHDPVVRVLGGGRYIIFVLLLAFNLLRLSFIPACGPVRSYATQAQRRSGYAAPLNLIYYAYTMLTLSPA